MRVYELGTVDEQFQWLRAWSTIDQDQLDSLAGFAVGANWGEVRVTLFREQRNFQQRIPSDHPYLTPGVPVLTARAIDVLRDLVEPHAEVLSLSSDDGLFFAVNVLAMPEALDHERSDLTRFPSSGRVMSVNRYVLAPEKVAGLPIFKLPEFPRSKVFVSDLFVNRVRQSGLTGFKFTPIWEGATPPDQGGASTT